MKNHHWLLILSLFLSQLAVSQNDTLVGVLRDVNKKGIKNYQITLGRDTPVTVKTDKDGIFTFPDVNLQDTLYVLIKKEKKTIDIPVKGHNFISITALQGNLTADYLSEPDQQLVETLKQRQSVKRNASVIKREEIQTTGCQDVYCLLRRLSGVRIENNRIIVRSGSSLNSPNDALIVLDGIPMESSNVLDNLAVTDIEEISVMKDASFYGVRGANGAIIVKTHK